MKDITQFTTNGVTVLAYKTPLWFVRASVYMGYMIMTVHNEASFIGEDQFFPPDKLQRALDKVKNIPEYKEVPVKLPEGNWKLHCVTDSVTEEQAKVLVDTGMDYTDFGYKNYESMSDSMFKYPFKTALEAIPGLLRSHGIDPKEKTVLLIKQD